MADLAKRLGGTIQFGNAYVSSTLYTVPAATTTIVRSLYAVNPLASPYSFSVTLGAFTSRLATNVVLSQQVAAYSTFVFNVFIVVTAGEMLAAAAESNSTNGNLTMYGIETT